MTESENLSRWKDSGDPHQWVWIRRGEWIDNELICLMTELRAGPYWPMDEAEVRQTLEGAAAVYRDLDRWGLLTPPAQEPPQDDDEIWF